MNQSPIEVELAALRRRGLRIDSIPDGVQIECSNAADLQFVCDAEDRLARDGIPFSTAMNVPPTGEATFRRWVLGAPAPSLARFLTPPASPFAPTAAADPLPRSPCCGRACPTCGAHQRNGVTPRPENSVRLPCRTQGPSRLITSCCFASAEQGCCTGCGSMEQPDAASPPS